MKSIIAITVSFFFFHFTVICQNGYSIFPESFDESYNEDLGNVTNLRFKALMGNNSDSTLTINWEIVNIDIPLEWGLSVSDKDMSYPPGPQITTNNGNPLTFYSGENNIPFNVDIYPNQISGCGTFEVIISLDASELILDTIEYEISINDDNCLISTTNNQYEDEKIEVFPNPFMDHLNIKTELDVKFVKIYNLSGIPLTPPLTNFQYFEVSNFESGMYLLEIVFEDDHKITRKIIHEK